uniref:Ephrin RBD domain-containing protein n=1 Tax=Wuchereria bancrofti TaxID=6293 RepID=A0A1I8EAU6_WUCBA
MENLKMNDRIRFSCSTSGTEQTAIHRVNEREALDCRGPAKFINSLIGTCMKTNDSIIIRLREIPMLPNEMSYKPDHDYFFITTSTGDKDGLENGEGGLCRTKNMRLKIRLESKWEGIVQKIPEFTAKNGPVMMIPVNPGQYAVPVVYIPVAQSSETNEGDKKRPMFPYHLYFANGQFQATNSNLEDLGSRTDNFFLFSRKSTFFDASDQPKIFKHLSFAISSNGYIVPKFLKEKEKDVDFEIEYTDSASRSKLEYAKLIFHSLHC